MVEASRASFESGFKALLAPAVDFPGLGLRDLVVAATATRHDSGTQRQFNTSGTLNVALRTRGNTIPYVAFGAGFVQTTGGTPAVTLTGSYRASPQLAGSVSPLNESDRVVVSETRENVMV